MMDFETLRVDAEDDRVTVRLVRAAVRNAISQRMVRELHLICDEIEQDPKVLVLCGTEGVFASGADIRELIDRTREDALGGINSGLFNRIAALPLPVVAVIDGHALGGGAELAFAADFRIGTPRLRIGNPEVGLGIIAAAGGTWRLRQLVGDALAKEILMAGKVLDGEAALKVGLISELHGSADVDAAARRFIDRIVVHDPLALRLTKSVFRAPESAHPLVDELAQAILFESPAKRERMRAFIERKSAR